VTETPSSSRSACEASPTNVSSVSAKGIGDFHRYVNYQLRDDKNEFVLECKLDTLLDTGSPVSFIKTSFIPPNLIEPALTGDDKYRGLNNSELEVKGRVRVKLALNDREAKCVSLLVVPPTSMKSSVIIGRNVLKQFFEKGNSNDREMEDEAVRELLSIEVHDPNETASDYLKINSEIETEIRKEMQKLFIVNYVKPERPDQPAVDTEVRLILKDFKPFHFSPRRLSYTEKNALRELLDSLLKRNIQASPSQSECASPIVLVRKKTGDVRL